MKEGTELTVERIPMHNLDGELLAYAVLEKYPRLLSLLREFGKCK